MWSLHTQIVKFCDLDESGYGKDMGMIKIYIKKCLAIQISEITCLSHFKNVICLLMFYRQYDTKLYFHITFSYPLHLSYETQKPQLKNAIIA